MKTLHALLPLLALAAIPAAAQTITTGSLPNGILNQDYTTTLQCSGCQGFTFGLIPGNGSLPPGLGLSPSGTISGIPSAVGTYTFGVGLYQPGISTPTGSRTFAITIPSGLTILTTTFPNGTLGTAYAQTLSASGGVGPPYTWSITSGSLPPGLGIANNNSIVGTPTSAGTYNFTISVFDQKQNGAFAQTSITIGNGTTGAAITTTSLPNGIVNIAYNTQLTCSNCASYTWSLTSGNLPLGLTLSAGGAISGTPSEAGSASFQVSLSPPPSQFSAAPPPTISQIYTLLINGAGLGITQNTIPIAFAGTPYSTTLNGTGGSTPYSWTLVSTSNDGLTIGSSTGILSGTPTANGQFTLSVMLADSSGLTLTKQFTLSVSTALSILTTTLPNGSVGTAYPLQTLQAGGGQPPYRWTIPTGKLPPGLTLDGVFGRISGTPTANGSFPFTLTVTDNQSNTATASLSITIGAGVTITITPTTPPAGTVGTAYAQTLIATGGTAPYSWAVLSQSTSAGSLPPGVSLNPSTGALTGTPTTTGTYTFSVQATDANQATGQAAITITIAAAAPLSITTASLANGTVGTAYSQTLAATGGVPAYTWSLSSGTLPAGLTLNAATGAITGTPTAAATASFVVQVADTAKGTATKNLGIVIGAAVAPLTITTTSIPAGTVGTAYSQTVGATGGTPPYKFSLSSTSNDGLSINASTGAITGTPTAAGSFTLVAVVTDSATTAQTATQNLALTVTSSVQTLTVTAAALPAGTVGVAYSQTPLKPAGGTPPYSYSLSSTNNDGLTINSGTGAISGSPTAAGTFTLVAVVKDSGTPQQQVSQNLSLTVNTATPPTPPAVTLTGVPTTSGFQQQLTPTLTIGSAYPSAITGTIALIFLPSVTATAGSTGTIDDALIRFTSGTTNRCIDFTVPANSTTPTLTGGANNITVMTGTTAGMITLTTTLGPTCQTPNTTPLTTPNTYSIVNAPGVPFISKVTLQQVAGGVTVVITGFSSTRDMTNASFQFAPATGDTFTSNNVSVPVQNAFNTWWANTAQSNPFGTQFTLTVPFTLATATQSASSVTVVSVTVTLQNSKGASNSVTLSQ